MISFRSHALPLVLVVAVLAVTGCASTVVDSGEAVVLKIKSSQLLVLPVVGLLLLLIGTVACCKLLPQIWRSEDSVGWKAKRSKIVLLPVIGVMLMAAVIPQGWYRVEVGSDYVQINEFPNKERFARTDIRRVSVEESVNNPGKSRLSIATKKGTQYYINEAEIGTESFERIAEAVKRMRARK